MVFNCTSGIASLEALKAVGAKNLQGKTLVDVSNPLDFSRGMPPTLTVCNTDSLGEQIQRAFPTAKVVKTLNTVTCAMMVDPAAIPGVHTMFVSGNDANAKAEVINILKTGFGWKEVMDLGEITGARGAPKGRTAADRGGFPTNYCGKSRTSYYWDNFDMEAPMQVHRTALFAVACAVVLTGCSASSAAISESDRGAMKSAVDGFTKAILGGDFAAAAAYWAEDATALPPHAATAHGRPAIQKLFAGFGKTTAFKQDVLETDGRGDLAYSRIAFDVTFTPPGATASITDKGKGILVWGKQRDGTWLVTRGAWNSDLPLPK